MPGEFSYYLEDGNRVKNMDHFKALQLSGDFAKNFDQENPEHLATIKKKYRELMLAFHPDKNELIDKERANICTQRITQAYRVLTGAEQDKQFSFNNDFDYDDLVEFFDETLERMDQLLARLARLNAPSAIDSGQSTALEAYGVADRFEKIIADFGQYLSTMLTEEILTKQRTVFKTIKDNAKTGEEFYALYLIAQRLDKFEKEFGSELLNSALSAKHPMAMFHVIDKALKGHYGDLNGSRKSAIKWGLSALSDLEKNIIPTLEKTDQNSETLLDNLQRLRNELAGILPDDIPPESDTEAFDTLVNSIEQNAVDKPTALFPLEDLSQVSDFVYEIEKPQHKESFEEQGLNSRFKQLKEAIQGLNLDMTLEIPDLPEEQLRIISSSPLELQALKKALADDFFVTVEEDELGLLIKNLDPPVSVVLIADGLEEAYQRLQPKATSSKQADDNSPSPVATAQANNPNTLFSAPTITNYLTQIEKIKNKADQLKTRGYNEASDAALALYTNLKEEHQKYERNPQNAQQFKDESRRLIADAENGILKNHRGFFGNLFHHILTALDCITRGAIHTRETDSSKIIRETKESLAAIRNANSEQPDDMPDSQVQP